jgi:hypothetical protein
MDTIQVGPHGELHNTQFFSIQGLFSYCEEAVQNEETNLRKAKFREAQLKNKIRLYDRAVIFEPWPSKPYALLKLKSELDKVQEKILSIEANLAARRGCYGEDSGLPGFCVGQFNLRRYKHPTFNPGEETMEDDVDLYN